MRTTVTVDDHVLRQAKEETARTGETLGHIVEEALRERFARRRLTPEQRRPIPELTTSGGTGVFPGVDLDNNAGLLDLMDDYDERGQFR